MKTKHLISFILILLVLPFSGLIAQDNSMQMFTVHEDRVKPSMMAQYEAACKELVAMCKEAGLTGSDWMALSATDFKYSYITKINSMADLDKDPFAGLTAKVGKDKMSNLWSKMDQCYEDHINYTIALDTKMSYQPGGINQMPNGKNYRKNTIYYVTPENYAAASKVGMKFKELFEKKGSKMHYRVYRSGYGTDGTFFMVAVAAESPAAYEKMVQENNALLGEEFAMLNQELLAVMERMETVEGYMRPELSYIAK